MSINHNLLLGYYLGWDLIDLQKRYVNLEKKFMKKSTPWQMSHVIANLLFQL